VNRVTLAKDGWLVENRRRVKDKALMLLGYKIELAPGYSLRSFFRMFDRYPVLTGLSEFLPDCLQRCRACPPEGCVTDAVGCLEFSKTVEMVGFPGKPRLEIYSSLCGVNDGRQCPLKALRLEDLLDLPLKLGGLKHIVFGDKVDVFEFETVFSLFELIEGIIWELSFQGTLRQCAL